ncbi:hypothetical protein COV18_06195 [Candidatus Woesearchaeota archaeon CG10_big_fil_rev_8_21_14_0_10_37_12]|nr:MAG: hypothetical protein COV18_06195 [Candidatus Woesearchaeota archaeon CG10_big_fil_rev_8_21_14_0_10_37_12]
MQQCILLRKVFGVYREFNDQRIRFGIREGLDRFVTYTQNPRVERGLVNAFDEFNVGGFKTDLRRELVPGRYGRMLTESKPFSGDKEIDALYNQLDYDAGDSFKLTFNRHLLYGEYATEFC